MTDEAQERVWSFGGGVQSAAIGVLIAQKRLPRPDLTVIADTGREASSTWAYLHEHIGPYLAAVGVTVDIAKHDLATVDLFLHKGRLLIPAYTSQGKGKLPTYCSNEWKRRVVLRWLRARGVNRAEMWLGISTDEVLRMKDSTDKWIAHRFPLIEDVPMTRAECVALVEVAGLPTPPRSSCWMCPHRGNAEWRDLRDNAPGDWDKAVALDDAIRERDPNTYVHRSGIPLRAADLTEPTSTDQRDLFECATGSCWT